VSLANLAINVNIAGADTARRDLRGIGDQARESFASGGRAATEFAAQVVKSSGGIRDASAHLAQMGQNMANMVATLNAQSKQLDVVKDKLNAAPDASKWQRYGIDVAASFGTAFGAGYAATQTWLDKLEEFAVAKMKTIAIGIAAGLAVAGGGIAYATYRAFKSGIGLITGGAYKSENIDSLVEQTKNARELAAALVVTAQEANATADALARLGLKNDDLTAAYDNSYKAMHTNTDELDRLGVKYKDASGNFLTQREFLGNAKKALDEYREGWDRNAAAVAMGLVSYAAVINALKVTTAEVVASKARLDEYNLGIGEDTVRAVAAWEQAMRNFNNESKLMSDGFKRAIADNIMPVLTDMAVMFENGLPFAVNAFRYSLAQLTSLMLGVKTVIDFVVDGFKGLTLSVGEFLTGAADASVKVLQGDFSGAAKAFQDGWKRAGTAVRGTWQEMVADATRNRDAMLMAWGFDDRRGGMIGGPGSAADKNKKIFIPKPGAEDKGHAKSPAGSAYAGFLEDLDRQNKRAEESEYAMLRLKAAQLAAAEGITNLSGAYQRISALQRSDGLKVLTDFGDKLAQQADDYASQTQALNLNGSALEKFSAQLAITRDVENTMRAARKAGKPIDEGVVALLRMQADAQADLAAQLINTRAAQERAFDTGITRALRDYTDGATNAADNAKNLITSTLRSAEDAFVQLNKTGKLNIKDLFATFQEELLRQEFRKFAANGLGGGGFINGAASLLGSLFTGGSNVLANRGFGGGGIGNLVGASTAGMSLAVGMPWVPRDGFPATLHQGERVMTREENAAYSAGGGSGSKMQVFQTFHVSGAADSRSQAQIAAAAARGLAVANVRNN
jgi:lambda family phage tail tape measure protein